MNPHDPVRCEKVDTRNQVAAFEVTHTEVSERPVKVVAHISSSLGAQQRHGGARRSEQIAQDIEGAFGNLLTFSCAGMARSWHIHPAVVLRTAMRAASLLLNGTLSIRGALRYVAYGSTIAQFIASAKPDTIILELCPGVSMIAGDIVLQSNIPYIVFPHNLEFLVPNAAPDISFRSYAGAFDVETSIYRRALSIFTISGFDAKILGCMGIQALVWPSFPPAEELPRLMQIRNSRLGSIDDREEVLVLGSAINPPTRTGMQNLLKSISSHSSWTRRINVIGYGTDTLDDPKTKNITIIGPANTETLDRYMQGCAFALIYQPPTTGFLTRLVELNLAGIPVAVIGGYEQARNLEDFGIFPFDSVDQIDAEMLIRAPMQMFGPPTIEQLWKDLFLANANYLASGK